MKILRRVIELCVVIAVFIVIRYVFEVYVSPVPPQSDYYNPASDIARQNFEITFSSFMFALVVVAYYCFVLANTRMKRSKVADSPNRIKERQKVITLRVTGCCFLCVPLLVVFILTSIDNGFLIAAPFAIFVLMFMAPYFLYKGLSPEFPLWYCAKICLIISGIFTGLILMTDSKFVAMAAATSIGGLPFAKDLSRKFIKAQNDIKVS